MFWVWFFSSFHFHRCKIHKQWTGNRLILFQWLLHGAKVRKERPEPLPWVPSFTQTCNYSRDINTWERQSFMCCLSSSCGLASLLQCSLGWLFWILILKANSPALVIDILGNTDQHQCHSHFFFMFLNIRAPQNHLLNACLRKLT